jgi:peptide/nickel transport system ATP-binding protein/oligopeptide transport system ATP-binding protein
MTAITDTILQIDNLHAHFFAQEGVVKAVNGVSLSMKRGSTLAIVGESGAGKSSVGLSILNMLPYPGRIIEGQIYLEGTELTTLPREQLRQIRGRDIAMIFQDPVNGLNPLLPVGEQIEETLRTHLHLNKKDAKTRTLELLYQVGLPDPESVSKSYAFQLSGGMCQRVMIALATALQPKLLIADEPTSALDVTVQASILDELNQLKTRYGMSIILITHDMGVVARMADEVIIMYAGTMMERGSTPDVFHRALNPYTWALMGTLPRLDRDDRAPLPSIKGTPPDLINMPDQCPFLPRCNKATLECREQPAPPLTEMAHEHYVACYNPIAFWADDD